MPENLLKLRISFCTVCMNRLEFLKRTLPKNIEDNLAYGNVEFLVLNYGSTDLIDEWIEKSMTPYLNSGILRYLKTSKPKYFLRSHSKNVSAKHANGDIICNVDADNFIGKGFANYINEKFTTNDHIFLGVERKDATKDCYGRICLKRTDFLAIRGYDEGMENYGFEDIDFKNRLKRLGLKELPITNKDFLGSIEHSDVARLENESNISIVKEIYIEYLNYFSSNVLYLFKNGTYKEGKIVVHLLKNSKSVENLFQEFEEGNKSSDPQNSTWNIESSKWKVGSWKKHELGITLKNGMVQNEWRYNGSPNKIFDNSKKERLYFKVLKNETFTGLVMFFSQINNCIKMYQNTKENKTYVNEVFGEIELD